MAAESRTWTNSREKIGKLGSAIHSVPAEVSASACTSEIDVKLFLCLNNKLFPQLLPYFFLDRGQPQNAFPHEAFETSQK
jgi:hypothetical protein